MSNVTGKQTAPSMYGSHKVMVDQNLSGEVKKWFRARHRKSDKFVVCQNDDMAAILVDLDQKHVKISGFSDLNNCPSIFLDAQVAPDPNKNFDTELFFSGFDGFDVFSASISKYSLRVCLVRSRLIG
jgi:hypothetical protein